MRCDSGCYQNAMMSDIVQGSTTAESLNEYVCALLRAWSRAGTVAVPTKAQINRDMRQYDNKQRILREPLYSKG